MSEFFGLGFSFGGLVFGFWGFFVVFFGGGGFARVGEGRARVVIFVFESTKFYKFYFAKHVHTYSKQ